MPNIGFAVKLSGTPQQVRRHPPLLGEHSAEVLAKRGIGAVELAELDAQGAFAAWATARFTWRSWTALQR